MDWFQEALKKLFDQPRNVFIASVIGSGILLTAYLGKSEIIPYTKRSHFLLLSKDMEIKLGKKQLKTITEANKLKVTHPDSIRVRSIATNVIEALKKRGNEGIDHFEGLKWEIWVVEGDEINAFCAPGGKIVVFTGLLRCLKTDAEIATILAHEIGHAVARHVAESVTKNVGIWIAELILCKYIKPDIVDYVSSLFLKLPISRSMESEADYIGLLLMSSAGYNPKVALEVYEKLGGHTTHDEYFSTHPSGKTRSQLLAQPHVMAQALTIYRQAVNTKHKVKLV